MEKSALSAYMRTWHRDAVFVRRGMGYREERPLGRGKLYQKETAAKYAPAVERFREDGLSIAKIAVAVILSAGTNCGCTKAAYPKKPLRRGDTATVAVTFEAEQKGYFRKTVTLTYHANGGTHTLPLTVKGNVR